MLSGEAKVSLDFDIKTFKDTVSVGKQLADELRVLKYMNATLQLDNCYLNKRSPIS